MLDRERRVHGAHDFIRFPRDGPVNWRTYIFGRSRSPSLRDHGFDLPKRQRPVPCGPVSSAPPRRWKQVTVRVERLVWRRHINHIVLETNLTIDLALALPELHTKLASAHPSGPAHTQVLPQKYPFDRSLALALAGNRRGRLEMKNTR